jgi:hypothetical protein
MSQNIHLLSSSDDNTPPVNKEPANETPIIEDPPTMEMLLQSTDLPFIKASGIYKQIPISIRKYIDNVTKTITSNQFVIDKNNALIESNIILKAQNEIPKKDSKNLSKMLNLIHIDAKNSLLDMIYDKHNSDLSKKNEELIALNTNLENKIINFNPLWLKEFTDYPTVHQIQFDSFQPRVNNDLLFQSTGHLFPIPSKESFSNLLLSVCYYYVKRCDIAVEYRSRQQDHIMKKDELQRIKDLKINKLNDLPMPQTHQELKQLITKFSKSSISEAKRKEKLQAVAKSKEVKDPKPRVARSKDKPPTTTSADNPQNSKGEKNSEGNSKENSKGTTKNTKNTKNAKRIKKQSKKYYKNKSSSKYFLEELLAFLQFSIPHNSFFVNMSTNPLHKFKQLLSLGPKFIPFQKHDPTNNEIIGNFEKFIRNLKLKKHFYQKDTTSSDTSWKFKVKLPSTWIPPLTANQFIPFNNDLKVMQEEFYKAITNLPKPHIRHSKLISSINELQSIKNIKITNADKNLGFCILDEDHYIILCRNHLDDPNQYQLLSVTAATHMVTLNKNLDIFINEWFLNQDDYINYINHSKLSHKIPNFYILPKIHKKGPLQGRPLTGAFNAPTTAISKILKPHLTELITTINPQANHILTNTMALINKLKALRLDPNRPKPTIITFDIKSLYPNIQLSKFKDLINTDDSYSTRFKVALLKFIEDNQSVQFLDLIYHQLLGIPMGDNCSVEIANYYLHCLLDTPLVNQLSKKDLILYGRYLDDGFAITYDPDSFFKILNRLLAIQKLELSDYEQSNVTVHFLDIWVTFSDKEITTSLYQKAMNKFLYLPYSSAHPSHIKSGWITGELLRIQRYSTLRLDYNVTKRLFYDRLLARCYPRKLLDNLFERNRFLPHASRIQNPSVHLILPFSLRNLTPLQKIISKYKNNMKTHTGFETTTSWTVGRNLSSYLCHSKLTSHEKSSLTTNSN